MGVAVALDVKNNGRMPATFVARAQTLGDGQSRQFGPDPAATAAHPANTGHDKLACTDCHKEAPGTLRQQLQAKVAENRPTDDLEIIRKAYDFSLKHHQGQTRASGEP